MWHYPQIDPVAISLGPLQIHWYALSYLIGISLVWWHLAVRNRQHAAAQGLSTDAPSQPKQSGKAKSAKKARAKTTIKTGLGPYQRPIWTPEQLSDLVFYAVMGVILGGRIGYMLFYGLDQIMANPLSILRIWEGGMSFHGGMLGVFIGMYWFGKKSGYSFFQVTDFIAPSIPIALGCGRIGNFINGELPGRITDVSWAVIFPGEAVARHPSSLYQATLEGPVLFLLLWLFARANRPTMAISGMFLVGYGSLRFISEFFRRPDLHMGKDGFIAFDWLTTGQLLSVPMVVFGIAFIAYSYRQTANLENKTT
jgi:phosphatidylglycerol:prolipoprotein diacylglycerol transferase